MICVTIGRGRHRMLLEEWKAAADAGAELVELRIDCLRRDVELSRLLANRYTPIVFTIRKSSDGGLWRGDEEKRRRLLREAIVAGVDYVDLEADTAPHIRRYGKTKRIISHHDFQHVPADLEDRAHRMAELDADVVKIAALARSVPQAARLLALPRDSKTPTIAIAMGEVGQFTRILGAKFGSPFTYSGFNPDRTFAPGMPLLADLRNDYAYDQINPDTEIYAVIGDPIGHSLSPAIHNAAFRHLGLNKVLVPLKIPPGEVPNALRALDFLRIRGISVTIPHKEDVVELLNRTDQAVELTGACNTLVIDEAGRLIGHNTDYQAAMTVLENALGGASDTELSPLLNKQVLILGAGGIARAIAFGATRRGAAVTLCNRNDERANKLAAEVGCRSVPWGMRAGTLCDILVNATPVGMHPEVNESPVPAAAFKPGMLAFDTVYHPESTLFLKYASQHDCKIVSGVELFVGQAAQQFRYYTGEPAPTDLMRDVIKRKFSPIKHA
jgi:3-dehydroquinate dehydratase/shikimate dehydrogenase